VGEEGGLLLPFPPRLHFFFLDCTDHRLTLVHLLSFLFGERTGQHQFVFGYNQKVEEMKGGRRKVGVPLSRFLFPCGKEARTLKGRSRVIVCASKGGVAGWPSPKRRCSVPQVPTDGLRSKLGESPLVAARVPPAYTIYIYIYIYIVWWVG
jgi:hypothetical protein